MRREDYSPEMRARVRAKLSDAENTFIFRDSNHLPFCLHLSLFLFMAGLLIYIFNINRATFSALVWLIAITTLLYLRYTTISFFHCSLVYTPFSPFFFRLYVGFAYAASRVCSWIRLRHRSDHFRNQYRDLRDRFIKGFIKAQEERLKKAALDLSSSDIDAEVFEGMLIILDDDQALESFFDAIPGFCASRLVQNRLDLRVKTKLEHSLNGFLDCTFSSHLVTESTRNDRLVICLNAAYSALGPSTVSGILGKFFSGRRDEALESVELGHSLISWGHSSDDLIYPIVRRIVACIISRTRDRNDRWAILVKKVFGIPEEVIRDHLAQGDSMLLANLLHAVREVLDTGRLEQGVLEFLSRFDIRNPSAELQHDFCALWNQIVQEARSQGSGSTPTQILAEIRHLFTTFHDGTDSAPIRFPAPISDDDSVLAWPWSYRSCNIANHHPDLPAADN